MYEGIKQATGPNVKKMAPLKSKTGVIITDGKKQKGRWVKHYLELYSAENTQLRIQCQKKLSTAFS